MGGLKLLDVLIEVCTEESEKATEITQLCAGVPLS